MCSLLEAGAADFDGMLVSFKSSDLPPGAIPKQGDKDEVRVRVEEVQVDDDDDGEEDGDRAEGEPQQKDHVVVRDDSPKKSLQDDMEDSSSATLAATETTGPHFPTSNTPLPDAPTFHGFGALPAELRIKIWSLSFGPRVVELRPTRPNSPNWAPARTDDRRPQVSFFFSHHTHMTVQISSTPLTHVKTSYSGNPAVPTRPPSPSVSKPGSSPSRTSASASRWRASPRVVLLPLMGIRTMKRPPTTTMTMTSGETSPRGPRSSTWGAARASAPAPPPPPSARAAAETARRRRRRQQQHGC